MGLFERLGEKVERIKRDIDTAKTASATAQCRSCGARSYSERETCPECGSQDLVFTDTAEGDDVEPTESDDQPESNDQPESDDDSTADPEVGAAAESTDGSTAGSPGSPAADTEETRAEEVGTEEAGAEDGDDDTRM